jgi:hypothetical protein
MRYFSGYSGCQKYVPFGVSQTKAVALTLSATLTYDNRYIIFFRKKDELLQTMGPVLFYGTAWLHCPSAACNHRSAQACLPGGTGYSQKRIGSKEAAAIAAQTRSAVV